MADKDRPDAKNEQLGPARMDRTTGYLTTQQGVRVDHTDDALTVGRSGDRLAEDFHAREKITQFDPERIPERVVHARGAGAYGYFEPYDEIPRASRSPSTPPTLCPASTSPTTQCCRHATSPISTPN